MLRRCLFALLALGASHFASAQIQATVQVTGAVSGAFTIDLEYLKTPTTVASFIGLATGQRGWLDHATGAIRHTGYYDGVTFHRVIAGFMSQTGSRKGDGTDGPGYSFKDEFDPTLRHDAAYVVSMANSGKHTNGSQIFITAAPQLHLNDKHSVFGRVIAGQAILDAINATPVSGERPDPPIVIQSISVSGPALASFDLFPPTLPQVIEGHPTLAKSGPAFTLGYDAHPYSAYTGYRGSDLAAWSVFKSSYAGGIAPSGSDDVTALATGARHFFRLARIDYGTTAARFIPASLAGRTFTFLNIFTVPVTFTFDAAGTGGTWNIPPSASGTMHTVTYTPGRYTMQMYVRINSTPIFGGDGEFLLTLDYAAANAGSFTGQTNFSGATNVAGTFTTTP